MATAPTANDLTRQQLDELDALLQRMLSMPAGSGDSLGATPAPAINWRNDTPGPTLSVVPHVSAPLPRPAEPEPFASARQPAPAAPAPEPSVPIEEFKFTPSPAPSVERKATPYPSPSRPAPTPAAASMPSIPGEPVPWPLLPLVGLNWVVDRVLGLCGPPGLILRSAFGKNLLGLIGIGLLAYTTAHIASGLGWLTLPFPLPWPK
jgi:hypothetical protein